jgi:hypothetical protein
MEEERARGVDPMDVRETVGGGVEADIEEEWVRKWRGK